MSHRLGTIRGALHVRSSGSRPYMGPTGSARGNHNPPTDYPHSTHRPFGLRCAQVRGTDLQFTKGNDKIPSTERPVGLGVPVSER
jgi:hypothetical protein